MGVGGGLRDGGTVPLAVAAHYTDYHFGQASPVADRCIDLMSSYVLQCVMINVIIRQL